ncbi:IS630 family transposase [Dehalococcoidia bacterium]|nr:IS630 family transposase [Dehalococcoidia bacterium]
MVLRVSIILGAAEGKGNSSIAKGLHASRPTVILWKRRFLEERIKGLEDIPRPGCPSPIKEEKVQEIVATTLSKPDNATHWGTRTLAKEMGVSHTTINRIWKRTKIQPHRVKSLKYSYDPELFSKVIDIVGLYLHPPENALVLAVDEKSQIQLLDRTRPMLPLRPGQVERHIHDYKRNGTTCLFSALNIANGSVIAKCQPRHRHQEFLKFLRLIERETPKEKDIHMILDNYATHKHPKIKEWLEKHPRYHLHFTPTSASWLNQVEIWFGILTRRQIRRGIFKSARDLVSSIEKYIKNHVTVHPVSSRSLLFT